MKITPNQSLILASDPSNPRARISTVAGGASGASDPGQVSTGTVLKTVTVTLRADYGAAAPARRARPTEEPIDVLATETDAADDTAFDHGLPARIAEPGAAPVGTALPARIAEPSAAPVGTAGRTDVRALTRSAATPASLAPVAEYARMQVQFPTAPKGTQLDVHA